MQQTFNIEKIDFDVNGVLAHGSKDAFVKRMVEAGAYPHHKADQKTAFLTAAWDKATSLKPAEEPKKTEAKK